MRILAPAAALVALTLAAPAAAETPAQRPHIDPAQAATLLQNPLVQEGAAQALTQLAGIVLDTRVGALAAVSPNGDIGPADTLRDVVRRDDPRFEQHLHDRTRDTLATAGVVAGSASVQMAELARTTARLKVALAPLLAMGNAAGARDDDGY